MNYYVTSDIHGFYSEYRQALATAGWDDDTGQRKIVLLGDIFDRGSEALLLQAFILDLLAKNEIILVRGNHEDLFERLIIEDRCMPYEGHIRNGTYDTALQLTGFDPITAITQYCRFSEAARDTPLHKQIIPAMRNYHETQNYIFVHGWIPCIKEGDEYTCCANWRDASEVEWAKARWYNGIQAAATVRDDKTIICGHWHTSYGYSHFWGKGSEFGPDACFAPYYNAGIIAIDGCTAHSGIVNVLVLDDEEMK